MGSGYAILTICTIFAGVALCASIALITFITLCAISSGRTRVALIAFLAGDALQALFSTVALLTLCAVRTSGSVLA